MTLHLNTNFSATAPGQLDFAPLAPNWQMHTNPSGRPERFVVASDATGAYLRFSVPGSGDTTSYRAELQSQENPAGFTSHYDNGEEFYASISLRLMEVPQDGAEGEVAVIQVHHVNT